MKRSIWLVLTTMLLAAGCGIQAPLQVGTNSLPDAAVRQSYAAQLVALGGNLPVVWSLASGSLPPGVSLSPDTGLISGTPQTRGEFNFSIRVTVNSTPPITALSRKLKISVKNAATATKLAIATTSLPSGAQKTSYSAVVVASGGSTPYTWSIDSGSLPPGLAFSSSTGALSGTPTTAGTYSFSVGVRDSSHPTQYASQSLTVAVASAPSTASPLAISTSSLPGGAVQVAYSAALAAFGGTTPYSWTITGGTLPPGLAFSSGTGAISGTPTQAGSFLFSAQVRDAQGQTASASLSATIAPPSSPVVTSLSPKSGPTSGGTTVTIGGSNFAAGASVTFGGTASPAVTVVSASQIQAVTPPEIAGTVSVSVEENGQAATINGAFTYTTVTPTVTGVSPDSGSTAGGTTVTISGSNFLTGALVLFGTVSATPANVTANQIQVVTPAHASGLVDVTVQNPGNVSGKVPGAFTYNSPSSGAPTITSVSPASGAPSTQVTIVGTNFVSADVVSFGSTSAGSTNFISATKLTAIVPSISEGTYNLTVTDPDPSSATLSNAFTVTAPAPAQSLLSGCVVNESNNTPSCSTPAGWTLVAAEGFGGGQAHVNSGQSFGYNNGANGGINTANPHVGSYSLQGYYGADGDVVADNISQGVVGSFSELYISYWDYVDPNATYPNSDYYLVDVKNPTGCEGGVQDWGIDSQPSLNQASYLTGYFIAVPGGAVVTDPGCQGYYQWNNGTNLQINAGVWRQYEFDYIPSTTVASGNQNPSLGNCAGPTDPGCGNGSFYMYVNGKLVVKSTNANLNGTVSMANAIIQVGGTITSFAAGGADTRCNPFSICSGTVPGTGAPKPFHRYLDDIIVMKR